LSSDAAIGSSFHIFADRNPPKILSDGYPIRDLAPPLFCPPFRHGNLTGHPLRGRGPASLLTRYGKRKRSIDFRGPIWERHGPDSAKWSTLVGAVLKAVEKEGYRLTRLPGRGRSNMWKVERNGETHRASFRTTRDRWIAFPPLNGGTKWKPLDEVDLVFIAAVSGSLRPERHRGLRVPAGDVRDRFSKAYAARVAAHQNVPVNFGMWIGLDVDPRRIPAGTGSGLADKYKPIAVYPVASLMDTGVASKVAQPDDAGDHHHKAEPPLRPTTIAKVLAETRKLVALIAGVAPEAVKLDLKIEY
jgi:hypothetical protein